jgi:predicted SnoaL-like aldol condensation-catalyzing enzyme
MDLMGTQEHSVSEDNITATNKALVLKAITACFVDRDTSIPGKHFAPDYKQHNPSIPNGNAATLALLSALSRTSSTSQA